MIVKGHLDRNSIKGEFGRSNCQRFVLAVLLLSSSSSPYFQICHCFFLAFGLYSVYISVVNCKNGSVLTGHRSLTASIGLQKTLFSKIVTVSFFPLPPIGSWQLAHTCPKCHSVPLQIADSCPTLFAILLSLFISPSFMCLLAALCATFIDFAHPIVRHQMSSLLANHVFK